jgi:hypothetical protein
MNARRAWVFRGSIILVFILMMVSFFGGPWWHAIIEPSGEGEGVFIYPYAFVTKVGGMAAQYIQAVEVPGFINWVPWAYLAVVVGALIFGLWKLRNKLSQWAVGLVGFSFAFYAWFFSFYAKMRMAEFDIPWSGREMVIGDPIGIYVTGIVTWTYYLAFAVGVLFIVLAIFRNKIVGKETA